MTERNGNRDADDAEERREAVADERDHLADARDARADARESADKVQQTKVTVVMKAARTRDARSDERDVDADERDEVATLEASVFGEATQAAEARRLAKKDRTHSSTDRFASGVDRSLLSDKDKT